MQDLFFIQVSFQQVNIWFQSQQIPVLKEIGIFKIMFTFALNEFQIDLLLNTFVKRSYAYISL